MQIAATDPNAYLTAADLFQRFARMWGVYIREAWPFAILHVVVMVTCYWPIREIQAESRALRKWREQDEGETECTRVLHEFVEETRLWGSQGTLVPMTDFTDRLDSKTNGLIDDLHSRVNLFLVLGIAGTFFAMFQFAIDAGEHFTHVAQTAEGQAGQDVAQMLAKHLSLAFPVGFFGLMLAVIGHFIAFRIDGRLRSAMTAACQKAMLFRRQAAKAQAFSLAEALSPLGNLHETLTHGLQPVFEGLRTQLEGTAGVLRDQVAPLADAVGRFETAAASLTEPARALTVAAEKLPEAMRHVEEMQVAEREHLTRLLETENQLRATIDQAATYLREATQGLAGLPAQLSNDFTAGITKMRDDAALLWSGLSAEFFRKIDPVGERLEQASGSLSAAAGSLAELPAALRSQIEKETAELNQLWFENQTAMLAATLQLQAATTELSTTPESIATAFRNQLKEMTEDAGHVWKESTNGFVSEFRNDLQERLSQIRIDSGKASEALAEAARNMQVAASEILEVVRNALKAQSAAALRELQPSLDILREAIDQRLPNVVANLKDAASYSGDMASQAAGATKTVEVILADIRASKRQLSEATVEVRNSVAGLIATQAPHAAEPLDLRPVLEAIHNLTDVIQRRSLWSQLIPFRRNGRETAS